ncbi:uncharacterized protein Z519_11102 [Cladophialophora bantiana CBS 173.52]|uniref:Tat pathway signal sequence n=1 Tax=Cladophialophora bantiana (strain ATCC 10958 / CBS 173.52 / CDC B-1940 / NIH 8579) TaxID=1442370 RepID=A0A0D2H5I3_CLAB1|nr:uncharacterized protein Z519_11102 [Cladophialophora bantiana CBS 173.52]KIW88533.1 hypothetical protein Z519_11102 [Cladophialophora bantiana CBS 173.52]
MPSSSDYASDSSGDTLIKQDYPSSPSPSSCPSSPIDEKKRRRYHRLHPPSSALSSLLLSRKNLDGDDDASGGYVMRDPRAHRVHKLLLGCVGVLSILCVSLIIAVVKLSATPKDVFRHVPEAKAEVIHTPGVMPPILGPEFTKRTVLFQRNESFMGSKEKAYPAWHEILHRARHGRVAFDSMPGEFYGVAGYHQLHCVWLLQWAVDYSVRGIVPDELTADHMFHCTEYLRQSVMCYADPTLERRFEGILGPFSANNTHVCGDWEKLMDWADDHIYLGPYLNPTTKLPP